MHILLLQPWLLAMQRGDSVIDRWYILLDVHGSTERLTPRALDRVLSPNQCAGRSESTYSEEYVVLSIQLRAYQNVGEITVKYFIIFRIYSSIALQ